MVAQMKSSFPGAIVTALILSSLAAIPVSAQTELQEQAVKQALSGKHLLVTYREGGALYGTYYIRDVYFCGSGKYYVQGQSRKDTVLGNTQVNNLNDSGSWQVGTINGIVVLRSQSYTGQSVVLPVVLQANGGVWFGEGITVVSRGSAPCR